MKSIELKKLILLGICLFCSACFSSDRNSNQDLSQTVYEILESYSNKDEAKFNQYINSEVGLNIIFSWETSSAFAQLKKICFSQACRIASDTRIPYEIIDRIKNQKLKYKKLKKSALLPKFVNSSCEQVDEEGVFVNTNVFNNIKVDIPKNGLEEINQLNNIKVVVSDNEQGFYSGNFIFYISRIDGSWWITVIDFATLDLDCHF